MSISTPAVWKAPCPTCGAILNIPGDYPSDVAACPLCGAAVAVPRPAIPGLEILGSSPSPGLVRPRSRRGNKAEVWAISGGVIALSAIVIAYAVRIATAPPPAEPSSEGDPGVAASRPTDEPAPPSLRPGGEAILDGRGKDKLYLAADGAWDDLAAADPAGIAHLIARGRVLCESNGGKVALISEKEGRWKVKVVEGVNVGSEGWLRADDLRAEAPRRPAPSLARSSKRGPRIVSVNESEAPKAEADPLGGSEAGGAFDAPNPARRGARGAFENPVHGRVSNFENPPSARRPGMAPRASTPNVPDPSFGPGDGASTTPEPGTTPTRIPPGDAPR